MPEALVDVPGVDESAAFEVFNRVLRPSREPCELSRPVPGLGAGALPGSDEALDLFELGACFGRPVAEVSIGSFLS